MTEEELRGAAEHLLSEFLLHSTNLQLIVRAHEEVIREIAPNLKRLVATRLQLLGGSEYAQKLIRTRSNAVGLLRSQDYEELAKLLGSLWSGQVEESEVP
ncbi:MAG TPA: hypothetical protein VGM02_04155 [Acidobacteriaceae bacterium]|jgi:hypothetical protein